MLELDVLCFIDEHITSLCLMPMPYALSADAVTPCTPLPQVRMHASAYVRIRQHTSAYVSLRCTHTHTLS
jgi:hypothetical protein